MLNNEPPREAASGRTMPRTELYEMLASRYPMCPKRALVVAAI